MTDMIVREETHVIAWSQSQVDLLKRTVAKDLTDDEFALFGYQCRRRGLDPFVRQIHAVKRGNQVTFQTGIDGYRLIAERTGLYRGQTEPQWCGKDGTWRDVWLDSAPPVAAKVGVYREGYRDAVSAVALWDEYHQENRDGSLAPMWRKMPALMLAKCAEALALRKAFPEELSGIYTDEEMGQSDNPRVSRPAQRPQARPEVIDAPPRQAPAVPISEWKKLVERGEPFGVKLPDTQGKNLIPRTWYERAEAMVQAAEAEAEARAKGVDLDGLPEAKSTDEYRQRAEFCRQRLRLHEAQPEPDEWPGDVPDDQNL